MVFFEHSSFIFIYFFGPLDFTLSLVLPCVFLLYSQFLEAFAPLYIFFLAYTVRGGPCSIISPSLCTLQLPSFPVLYNCNCISQSFSPLIL
jgi:hypothetical protein